MTHMSVVLSKEPPLPAGQSLGRCGQICLMFFCVLGQPHTLLGHLLHVSSKKVHTA